MSDDSLKKTKKEGLSDAAREALERAQKEKDLEKAAALKAERETPAAMPGTPHGKDDIAPLKKPVPTADSDDEAPLKSFQKIDPEDREIGAHRGAGRGSDDHGHGAPPPKGERRPTLLLAEYGSPGACLRAAEKLRDAGYTKFDTHTPFPIHGMDRAMGLPDSKLGWIVLAMGITGTTCAWVMMYWMNAVDYPLVIGGKPPGALPSMVPIMFELTVLLSSFGAVFGMLGLNKLPRHHHPIFESERFKGFSDDKFFVSVEVDDPKFKLERTRELLERTRADHLELLEEDVP